MVVDVHHALQHEDGQAWEEAGAGETEPDPVGELQNATDSCQISGGHQADDTTGATDIMDLSLARNIIQDCSVIVGIHPDQVDLASHLKA